MTSVGLGLPIGAGDRGQINGISQQDFLRILTTQLTFQDPLKPLDNQQFMAQMAQFSALEQSRMANEKTDAMLALQSANQSLGLIGRTVEVASSDGKIVGQVTTVSFERQQPLLTVKAADGALLTDISLGQVARVRGGAS